MKTGREPRGYVPSRKQMAFDWYATRVMRYIIGPGVMGWELAIDKAHNVAVFLVGALLASSMDVRSYVRGLIHMARQEQRSLQDLVDEEERRNDDDHS